MAAGQVAGHDCQVNAQLRRGCPRSQVHPARYLSRGTNTGFAVHRQLSARALVQPAREGRTVARFWAQQVLRELLMFPKLNQGRMLELGRKYGLVSACGVCACGAETRSLTLRRSHQPRTCSCCMCVCWRLRVNVCQCQC